MATLRRAGFGSVFEVENETVGIGTTGTATNTLQVLGDIKSSDATVIGLSTLTTYQGFVDKEARFGKALIDVESQAGTLGEVVIEGDVTVSSASTLTSSVNQLTLTDSFSVPTGNTDSRIHCHTAGSMRFNEDLGTLEFYTGDMWKTVNSFADTGNRGRCVWAGGYDKNGVPSSNTSRIDFINSHTLGNSRNFGNLTAAGQDAHGSGNANRGLFQGRFNSDAIEYITIASEGDSIDFGDRTQAAYYTASASSSTRAVTMGGLSPSTPASNVIDYVQIMTLGNAIDFGDMSMGRLTDGSAFSSSVEAFVCGGYPATEKTYEVINIASTGNSIAGDNIRHGGYWPGAGCSNSTRGIWAGGANNPSSYSREISHITMASKGNAQFFGDLSNTSQGGAGAGSNQTRGIIAFGMSTDGNYNDLNILEFITFSSSGNAQDFGDLRGGTNAVHTRHISPVSDSHGGLGGF